MHEQHRTSWWEYLYINQFKLAGVFIRCAFSFVSKIGKKSLNFWHRSITFNSNKSLTWCNNFSVYYPYVCLQLNMFRAFSRPSSGAQWLQCQSCPTTNTARLSPRYEGKTRGCHCSHWAPEDGRATPETWWAVNKRKDNKLKNCCIRLVIYLN